jgi:hypothetical protein
MFLLALLLPGIDLMITGRIFKGIICIFLQVTLIGWILASWWAISIRNEAARLAESTGELADDGNAAVNVAGLAVASTIINSDKAEAKELDSQKTAEMSDDSQDLSEDASADNSDDGDEEGGFLSGMLDDDDDD